MSMCELFVSAVVSGFHFLPEQYFFPVQGHGVLFGLFYFAVLETTIYTIGFSVM